MLAWRVQAWAPAWTAAQGEPRGRVGQVEVADLVDGQVAVDRGAGADGEAGLGADAGHDQDQAGVQGDGLPAGGGRVDAQPGGRPGFGAMDLAGRRPLPASRRQGWPVNHAAILT